MPDEFAPDEEIAATVRNSVRAVDNRNERVALFQDTVRGGDKPGPLWALLRSVGDAYAEFWAAEQVGGVTVAEETRLNRVLDKAMATADWLTDGARTADASETGEQR